MHFPQTIVLAATALFAVASADYMIDPASVSNSTRQYWCESQTSTCPILCQQVEPGTTLVNTCDPIALRYGCLCGNNQQPNMSEYTLTLPYWTCTAWVQQCQTACGDHADECISACAQDHPCGASNPTRLNTTSASSTSTTVGPTSSPTGDAIYNGPNGADDNGDSSSSSSSSSDNSNGAAAALDAGSRLGLGVLVGTLLVGFGMVA